MDLEQLQLEADKDLKINDTELDLESLKTPQLHNKYMKHLTKFKLLLSKAETDYSTMKRDKWEYYTGKAPAEVYEKEPFDYKVREKDAIQRHLDADEKLTTIDLKIRYYDVQLKFLEEIIKTVANRTFQIKNAIEWQKFQAGF